MLLSSNKKHEHPISKMQHIIKECLNNIHEFTKESSYGDFDLKQTCILQEFRIIDKTTKNYMRIYLLDKKVDFRSEGGHYICRFNLVEDTIYSEYYLLNLDIREQLDNFIYRLYYNLKYLI